ncbi:electron transfer flavoprotein subunit beta/FixA family protein [Streptomyces sp. NPDC057620]|uniref:electron transfer flavoprotein subunit beta/FixA family protein n=1 Tax=Streptomyces sp. NPDC057620 TaxID=3346185 RepID=UPI00369B08EC
MTLRIVVLVKYVPDASGDRGFDPDTTADRASTDGLLCELDEYAVEQALQIAEGDSEARVTVVTVGPEEAAVALHKALAMGADDAVHITDEAIHGSDALATSAIIAKAVELTGYDLVVHGMASTDGAMGVMPALVAERLGTPQLTLLSEVAVQDGIVSGRRDGDKGTLHLRAKLPAVISVTDQSGEARYPSFKGIMAAKKKQVHTLDLAHLSMAPDQVGKAAARTTVKTITARPPRPPGTVVTDDGDGSRRLAEFLRATSLV